MAKWYIKDISKLTNVSKQTLRYYDEVNVLKPSIRLTNGYRMYSEEDLIKLQKIIVLKDCDFKLSQIKELILLDINSLELYSKQAQLLEEKSKKLFERSLKLRNFISKSIEQKAICWIELIKTPDFS